MSDRGRKHMTGRRIALVLAWRRCWQRRACRPAGTTIPATADKGGGKTIALLLPETKTTRYEAHDRPEFEAKVKELCPDCKVDYANATQDATKQQQQAEAAITKGAERARARRGGRQVGRGDRAAREAVERPRDRLRPADLRTPTWTTTCRSTTCARAGSRPRRCSTSSAPRQGQVDRDDQRLAHRPERRATTRRARTRCSTRAA